MASAGTERDFSSTMEVFIEKVKQHPCLWKTGEMCYRDTAKKDFAWEKIARECGMVNGREAKTQWKKLRDSHREALRRRKTATGEPVLNLKPWKYEFLMDFVLSQAENNYSHNSTTLQEKIHDKKNSLDTDVMVEFPPQQSESSFPSSSAVEPESRKRKKLSTPTSTAIFQDREKRREQRKSERNDLRISNIDTNRSQDAMLALFTSLYQKTRELPKSLQLRVEREIFESVSRAEVEALAADTRNKATPTRIIPLYECTIKSEQDSHLLVEASPSPGTFSDDSQS